MAKKNITVSFTDGTTETFTDMNGCTLNDTKAVLSLWDTFQHFDIILRNVKYFHVMEIDLD